MAEFLLELLSEEIPARMQARAAEDLKRLVGERLSAAGLCYSDAQAYVTPRRLALVVDGLPTKQPDVTEERRGPRVGAPEPAIQGFLKANGLTSIEQAEVRETDRGAFYFAVRRVKGQATAKVLPEVIADTVHALPWPKSMRWEHGDFRWVRPLHNILAILDGKPIQLAFDLVGSGVDFDPDLQSFDDTYTREYCEKFRTLIANNSTVGHRFLAPKRFKVKGFSDYAAKLARARVILDPEERRAEILKQAKRKAARAGLKLRDDPALIDEVTGLVEWPVVLMGRIDEAFMDLPPEVLTSTMRTQQKYLALTDRDAKLANRFLVVANMETADKGKAIVAGNERVLRARLADARFFWDQDRKVPLASRTPQLREIVFHEKLGTLDEKVDRVQALATEIADYVPGADKDRVRSAARLAKADLVTGMVGEFPELQGVIGRYYALHDGEHVDVANAIAEHYSPQGPNDACPSAPVSVAVALADKIDTLVGFFAIGETPTGSKDPYALRRAALGVIRLIVENGLRVPLFNVIRVAIRPLRKSRSLPAGFRPPFDSVSVRQGLMEFFADRLKVALREKGVRHDLISAVFAVGGEDDLVRLLARVAALDGFLHTEDGADLLVAYQRAANIVRIEEKRDGRTYAEVKRDLFLQPEEDALWQNFFGVQESQKHALDREQFELAMEMLASLRPYVDNFFDRVTVNVAEDERRGNRLALLKGIVTVMDQVADFSKIEG